MAMDFECLCACENEKHALNLIMAITFFISAPQDGQNVGKHVHAS